MNGQLMTLSTFNTIKTGRKTATTTAVELCAGASRLPGRQKVAVQNNGNDNIGIGDTSLAIGTGWLLLPGDTLVLECGETPIFILSATTSDYGVMEVA